LNDFKESKQLKGIVRVKGNVNMDDLPKPEPTDFPIEKYGYSPAITEKPFFALQSSKGCPYGCSYYCVYGKFQGPKVNLRSPKKVVQDMIHLNKNYGIKGFQFRDPTFGIKKGYIEEFCEEIEKNDLNVKWGIETRIDLLDKDKITMMFKNGLRNINFGIETVDEEVAKKNKRLLINQRKQEEIIKFCENIGVKVSAFYIIGYVNDTKKSIRNTINYSKKLNTFLARFAVCTPYPGTDFYDELKKKNKILTYECENYTQFNPIIKYDHMKPEDVSGLLSNAFTEYYFRPTYLFKVFLWKIRELWL